MKKIYLFLATLSLTLVLLISSNGAVSATTTLNMSNGQSAEAAELGSLPADMPTHQPSTFVSQTPVNTLNSPIPASNQMSTDARQVDVLSEALLGHWTTNAGGTHSYFGPNKVIVVNTLNRQLAERSPQLHKQVMPYEITSASETSNVLHLRVQTRSGWAQTRMLRFAGDRQAFTESMDLLGHAFVTTWTYIDGQQQP